TISKRDWSSDVCSSDLRWLIKSKIMLYYISFYLRWLLVHDKRYKVIVNQSICKKFLKSDLMFDHSCCFTCLLPYFLSKYLSNLTLLIHTIIKTITVMGNDARTRSIAFTFIFND